MKNLALVILIFISASCSAQSYKIGKMDADGKTHLTMDQTKCSMLINQLTAKQNTKPVQISELTFTRLSRGQVCLTGYEKDAGGKIIQGVRIQCSQDDENNLIITKTNFSERISGKNFDSSITQN